ncbi:DUF2530 domain-containing protein [Acidipropionibacterium acidipropionici]|jgi:predicted phage tail protein|uniref:DUF2530 domain-containing protein n=1 Tax=Acidipropionibacterium acidipropionici TaxID=1748 RepID=UPI00110A9AC9|nr:DUF2530 domain-containing protein [Acidipropionibacterium acidipropionici]QCV95710.1 DUF2530 domain-containing protein [Acidipropionibacterium acidipropionici]
MGNTDDRQDVEVLDDDRPRGLVQATVPPLDQDGLTGAMVGTAAFLAAFVVCWIRLDALRTAGYGDWLWICLTGAALGIVGILYMSRRRHKLAANQSNSDESTEIVS